MFANKFLHVLVYTLLFTIALGACSPIISSALEPIHELVFDAHGQAFTGPEGIPAGVVKLGFTNHEKTWQRIQVFKLTEGKSFNDFKIASTSADLLPWAKPYGGPNATAPGQSFSVVMSLDPGNYVLTCDPLDQAGNSFPVRRMMRALTVTDSTVRALEPNFDLTLNLTDAGASLFGSLVPGAHIIRVENLGSQTYQVLLYKLNGEKSLTPSMATFLPDAAPNNLSGMIIGGVSDLMPGAHQYLVVNLYPGNYFVASMNASLSNYSNWRGNRFTIQ